MSEERPGWDLPLAQDLLRRIEKELAGQYHVGLLGSVILSGSSRKDVDIVIYPAWSDHTLRVFPNPNTRNALIRAGLGRRCDVAGVHEEWRKKGSKDTKAVEVWVDEEGRRVDVFYLR